MRLILAGGFALAAFASVTGAQARPAECLMIINGRTLIDGRCEFDRGPDGSFRLESATHIGHVMVNTGGAGEGIWTTTPEVRSNFRNTSALRRNGACWTGGNTTFCAWGLGQRPQAQAPLNPLAQPLARAPAHPRAPAATGRHYEKPISVRNIKLRNTDKETRCTYYADIMVREALDGPTAGNPRIVAPADGAPCSSAPATSGRVIGLEDHALSGRAGNLLFFQIMDGHGSVPFSVFDIHKGRTVFHDATVGDFKLVTTRRDGSVRLHYERGINADCSILKDARGCWAKLVAEKKIPPVMADRVPQGGICATAYAKSLGSPTPADAPSIVSYDIEMTIDPQGTIDIESRGVIKCRPLP